MPDEPKISFGQALEVFQGQIIVKVKSIMLLKISYVSQIFLWAMPNEP